MSNLFSQVLNMSMTGSVVILLVMLARLILKRAPKIFSYALWSVVLFRLLCPVAFTAPISVLDLVEPEQKETSNNISIVSYIPATVDTQADFIMVQPEEQPVRVENAIKPEEQLRMTPMRAVALVWAAGTVGMILYSVAQYLTLRRKLIGSIQLKWNIYLADHIDTAFVVGLLQPKIYLPSSVPAKERYYILAHEQHHIRRLDHVIKLLAYLALCIHWFNPLVWIAFVLAGKDMEMSCDEAVIKKLGADIRPNYSASLLRLATHKKILSGMPLAFGEGDTKGRVLNMSKWKKPTKWLVTICVILCLCVVVVCAFNPEEEKSIEELTNHTSDQPVGTGIGDLFFTYPAGLTSELREVENWTRDEQKRILKGLPNRGQYDNYFIDNGVDFGGVVDFIVPENRDINLEKLNLPSEWVGLDYIAESSAYPYAEREYTLIKDGKDYIQMYLYTYSGRGYFLWFYTEQGNPAHKQAILESVELGSSIINATKLRQDQIVSLGLFNITIPKGYGYYRNETTILEITKKDFFGNQYILGCVTARPNPNLPMETEDDLAKWAEAVVTDLQSEGNSYSITDDTEYGDILLTIHNYSGMPSEDEEHYLYIAGDIVYEFWIAPSSLHDNTVAAILNSIWLKESTGIPAKHTSETAPIVNGQDIVTDTELVEYGSLKLLLPSGFSSALQDGVVTLTKESVVVGGIRSWNYPEFQPSDIVELKKEESGAPIGYMSGSPTYGDMEYEIFWDGNPDGLNEQHTFFIDGDIIYDVWYDENQISDGIAERFLKTVAINADPVVATEPGEQEAFAKCRAVLDAVQNGSYKINTRQVSGKNENAMAHERIYSRTGEDWFSVTNVLPMGDDFSGEVEFAETKSALHVNGKYYNYTGTEWVEIADAENFRLPWLADFTWDENIVAYMDTLTDENGECVMLRVDKKYKDSDDYDPHYFLYFNFDPDGNFVNAQLQVNLFRDNELSITESIVSLDQETVNAEIQKEYQRAIG